MAHSGQPPALLQSVRVFCAPDAPNGYSMAVVALDIFHQDVVAPGLDCHAVVTVADADVVDVDVGRPHRFDAVGVRRVGVLRVSPTGCVRELQSIVFTDRPA